MNGKSIKRLVITIPAVIFAVCVLTSIAYALTINETRVTTDGSYHSAPAISGDTIVWQDNRNGNWDIYMCSASNPAVQTQVTTDTNGQFAPAISGDTIVWQDNRGWSSPTFVDTLE